MGKKMNCEENVSYSRFIEGLRRKAKVMWIALYFVGDKMAS